MSPDRWTTLTGFGAGGPEQERAAWAHGLGSRLKSTPRMCIVEARPPGRAGWLIDVRRTGHAHLREIANDKHRYVCLSLPSPLSKCDCLADIKLWPPDLRLRLIISEAAKQR